MHQGRQLRRNFFVSRSVVRNPGRLASPDLKWQSDSGKRDFWRPGTHGRLYLRRAECRPRASDAFVGDMGVDRCRDCKAPDFAQVQNFKGKLRDYASQTMCARIGDEALLVHGADRAVQICGASFSGERAFRRKAMELFFATSPTIASPAIASPAIAVFTRLAIAFAAHALPAGRRLTLTVTLSRVDQTGRFVGLCRIAALRRGISRL